MAKRDDQVGAALARLIAGPSKPDRKKPEPLDYDAYADDGPTWDELHSEAMRKGRKRSR